MFSAIDHVMRFAGQRTCSKPSLAAHTPWAGSHGQMGSWVQPALQGVGGLGGSALCQPGGRVVVGSPGSSRGPTMTACPHPQVTRAASACCASCRTTSSRPLPTAATPSSPCPSSGTCEVRAASSQGGRHCREVLGGGMGASLEALCTERSRLKPALEPDGHGAVHGAGDDPHPGPFPQDPAGSARPGAVCFGRGGR